MSRIRVLRVMARMNVGGPALQVVNLARMLDQDQFDQRILVGAVGADEADYLELRAPDIAVTRVEGLGRSVRPGSDVGAFAQISREIASFRPDIVHTHTAKAGVLGRVAARTRRVPHVVHTFHGHLLHGYFSPRVTDLVRRTERVLAVRTDRLLAVGSRVRDDLLAAGIGRPDQFEVVPPGVVLPPAPDQAEARRRLGLPADAPVVAFVGRITAVKRPDRLVEVAALVGRTHPDAVVVVVGEGDLLGTTSAAAAATRRDIRFLGWRPDVEVVYAAADLIVLTSDNEGMPVTLIEASLAGRPSVTTDVGSAREVVIDGETGLVTTTDPAAVAGAVVALLDDRSRRLAMGAAAAARAAARFSAERLIRDTERIYEDLVAERGR